MASAPATPPPGWSGRIRFARDPEGGFFYRPDEIIVLEPFDDSPVTEASEDGRKTYQIPKVMEFIETSLRVKLDPPLTFNRIHLIGLPAGANVLNLVADLNDAGVQAEPNYVLFATTMYGNPLYGNPLYGNPLYGNPLYGNPLYGNPLYGNPLYGNPLYGNPLYGNPLYGNPLYGNPLGYDYKKTGERLNSAQPAPSLQVDLWDQKKARTEPTICILDSGIAGPITYPPAGGSGTGSAVTKNHLPGLLQGVTPVAGWGTFNKTATPYHYPPISAIDGPDVDGDTALDPIAGHGTFIAGVVELLAPGHDLKPFKIFELEGDVDSAKMAFCLNELVASPPKGLKVDDKTLINLSVGGYAPKAMMALARSVRKVQDKGAVVVASAGNDATWRPAYPACLPDVVSVGALGPFGPALFTNFGPWVRACAPGVEIVSSFFQEFQGPLPGPSTKIDPDRFEGWARWSGTSFAAPVVVAALAREMDRSKCTAEQAVERVIDAPGLLRIPGLGTVVNIA